VQNTCLRELGASECGVADDYLTNGLGRWLFPRPWGKFSLLPPCSRWGLFLRSLGRNRRSSWFEPEPPAWHPARAECRLRSRTPSDWRSTSRTQYQRVTCGSPSPTEDRLARMWASRCVVIATRGSEFGSHDQPAHAHPTDSLLQVTRLVSTDRSRRPHGVQSPSVTLTTPRPKIERYPPTKS